MSFHLPENYELIAGARVENIHFYYKLVKVTAVAFTHYIKIILNVPLNQLVAILIYIKHRLCLRGLLTIRLFNIYLNFHIFALITFSTTFVYSSGIEILQYKPHFYTSSPHTNIQQSPNKLRIQLIFPDG